MQTDNRRLAWRDQRERSKNDVFVAVSDWNRPRRGGGKGWRVLGDLLVATSGGVASRWAALPFESGEPSHVVNEVGVGERGSRTDGSG